jgi:cysteine desulfurase
VRPNPNNLAIKGAAEFYKDRGRHIVTSVIEHKAVLDTCKRLEREGFDVTYLPVATDGRVDPGGRARRHHRQDGAGLDHAGQQRDRDGVPVNEIGAVVKEGAPCSTSTPFRASARFPSTSRGAKADLVSLSAHKMYGPKGVGALYVRRKPRVRLTPSSTAADTNAACARGR